MCAAAARRPIVIVLDDLQAADVATVRLLEFLAGRIHRARILAIGTSRLSTARRDSDLTLALADLGKVAQRLVLGGLSRSELQELVTAHGPDPPQALVDHLHAVTEGNPLFADELYAPAGHGDRRRGDQGASVFRRACAARSAGGSIRPRRRSRARSPQAPSSGPSSASRP